MHISTSSHVHLNEPGRTHWEGFRTGTQAAVSGGVTAVIDMPLNSIPPTTTVANLEVKREAARSTDLYTDVGFWGGVVPGNHVRLEVFFDRLTFIERLMQNDLVPLIDAGVRGFKCFTIESGVEVSHNFALSKQRRTLVVIAVISSAGISVRPRAGPRSSNTPTYPQEHAYVSCGIGHWSTGPPGPSARY